jgi:mono/diheme cytochrome c family protein
MPRVVPLVGILLVACLVTLVAVGAVPPPQSPYPPPQPKVLAQSATSAARGEQLVMLGGCNDCHTPKLPGGRLNVARALSGQPLGAPIPPDAPGAVTANMMLTAWRGPWGVTVARNITPDKETGIGAWTLADFKRTIRTGVDPKGQVLNPPMPIEGLQNLPDEDLEAIYNYLRTLKPVRNDTSGKAGVPAATKPGFK